MVGQVDTEQFSGHKGQSLEYGKDVWTKYILPTQHVLYFGLQAKKKARRRRGEPVQQRQHRRDLRPGADAARDTRSSISKTTSTS